MEKNRLEEVACKHSVFMQSFHPTRFALGCQLSIVHPTLICIRCLWCLFFDDFASYMEIIILTPEPLIITGDFNIHVNNTNDSDACEFLDLLVSLGLKQYVIGPTHEGDHTLDLMITRQYDQVINSAPMIDRFISDHAAVLCQLDSVKPCTAVKEISYRQLKSIDMDALRADLTTSELCTNVFTDLDMMVSCYNSTPSSLLDKYAPLRT